MERTKQHNLSEKQQQACGRDELCNDRFLEIYLALGSGCSTAVGRMPQGQEVVDSYPTESDPFSLSLSKCLSKQVS